MADEGEYSDGWDEAPRATVGFKPEEITAIMNDFAEPETLAPTSLYLGGTKYTVIDPRRSRGCHKRKEELNQCMFVFSSLVFGSLPFCLIDQITVYLWAFLS
ncbi:hypothetical protein RHMOL_Rhmol03G0015300 [Rhododendron molle]|uniref:Uncharacterized protein n=1 Tax=Rhododendron molle TaxID=49168 RepID=A0ACC0P917_RHOML|nr:hypothetical protein RHMOL_Rhmol03G0015300 [Rhododendron molle]